MSAKDVAAKEEERLLRSMARQGRSVTSKPQVKGNSTEPVHCKSTLPEGYVSTAERLDTQGKVAASSPAEPQGEVVTTTQLYEKTEEEILEESKQRNAKEEDRIQKHLVCTGISEEQLAQNAEDQAKREATFQKANERLQAYEVKKQQELEKQQQEEDKMKKQVAAANISALLQLRR